MTFDPYDWTRPVIGSEREYAERTGERHCDDFILDPLSLMAYGYVAHNQDGGVEGFESREGKK